MLFFIIDKTQNDAYRPDPEVSDRVIAWLRTERREPFFLWVHYLGPHDRPEPGDDPAAWPLPQVQRYDAYLTITDEQVGRVLDALDELGLRDNTAVILHADHGESLMEHNYFGHGRNVLDPTQRVPLLMRLPGRFPAGRRVTHLVRNLDLFPTVLDLLGVRLTVPVDGASLLPLISGSTASASEETYVETYLSANTLFAETIGDQLVAFRRLGVRTPDWKFVVNDPVPIMDHDNPAPVTEAMRRQHFSEALYDLRSDPGETRNVIGNHADLAARFRSRLAQYQTAHTSGSERLELDASDRERLRSLGYLE